MTTTNDEWMPLDLADDEVAEYTALREDVPEYLYRSLWMWIFDRFTTGTASVGGRPFNVDLTRTCERVLKISIADSGKYADQSFRAVQDSVLDGPPIRVWRLVDFLASRCGPRGSQIEQLDKILVQSGSAWQVGERQGKPGLVRRLPEGVKAAVEAAFKKPNAGKRLAIAFEDVFGVNPNPSKAYWFAVKAVEYASAPVVIPNDPAPTLGTSAGWSRAVSSTCRTSARILGR